MVRKDGKDFYEFLSSVNTFDFEDDIDGLGLNILNLKHMKRKKIKIYKRYF